VIVKRSITTSRVKEKLLRICGSEDGFKELESLDRDLVMGVHGHKYNGDLRLSQQFDYVELSAEMISMN